MPITNFAVLSPELKLIEHNLTVNIRNNVKKFFNRSEKTHNECFKCGCLSTKSVYTNDYMSTARICIICTYCGNTIKTIYE